MNAQQLVEKLETAIYDAKLNAAKNAVIEIFNEGVKRGRVERGSEIKVEQAQKEEIVRLEEVAKKYQLAAKQNFNLVATNQETIKELEITINQLREEVQQFREISEQRLTLANNRQIVINKQEKQVNQLQDEIYSLRKTNTFRNSQISNLQNSLEESMRNNAALKEQLAKNEKVNANLYDAAFLRGYNAGKEAATRQTTSGGSLTPDPA